MGKPAFENYLLSIEAHIGTLLETIESIERKIKTLTTRVRDQVNLVESQKSLAENVAELEKARFNYPEDGLLCLRGILTIEQVKNFDMTNLQGDPVRRVLKRGFATNTTIGTLTGYMSFVRKYFPTGSLESIELPIIPHEHGTGTFSEGGDSGCIIVSPAGEYVSLLTGGTNKGTDGSDITYSTMFNWVWKLVLEEFPGANLYFEDMGAFLAASV